MDHRLSSHRAPIRAAFTLVEILIVVMILAILAALVVPKFSNAARLSRENMLREDLRFMRSQIVIYNAEHNSVAPGYPNGDITATPTEEAFVQQLTRPTNAAGKVGDASGPSYPFGPYFSTMPPNPITDLATVRVLTDAQAFPDEAAGTHGWVYHPQTMKLASDALGSDDKGVDYFEY